MPTADIEGLQIHYDHYAASETAAPVRVLYIHGTGCNSRVFASHIASLGPSVEAVAIDLPGHGRSGGNGFRGAADHAFFVGALIEHLEWDRCVVAGHSLGGGIALSVALYFPASVQALMLIDTGARLRVNPKVLDYARAAAARGRGVAENSRFGYADSTPQSVIDEVNALTADCDPRVKYKDWIADDSFDVMSRLGQIACPALAICGEEDPLTLLKYHEYLRDHLPNCDMVTVPKAGHWPFVENPVEFNARIQSFLERL